MYSKVPRRDEVKGTIASCWDLVPPGSWPLTKRRSSVDMYIGVNKLCVICI